MSTLQGTKIKDTYPGLIKTSDNAVIGATEKVLEDGQGNATTLSVGTASASFTGTLDLAGATVTGLSDTTYDLASAQDGANVDITLTGSDASVDTVQLTAGTNITLTEAAGSITIDAAGGGGGGSTPPMSMNVLPPSKGSFLNDAESWRTWVYTTGYSLANTNVNDSQSSYGVFPMYEGATISSIQFQVGTAVAASDIWCAIYRIGTDANGQMILTDRLLDCGTASSETTGTKQLDLATPFTMPAGETFGAVGIIIGGNTTGTTCKSWSNAVWNGNGGRAVSNTFYRNMELLITTDYSSPPESLSAATYSHNTSKGIYILIK